MPTVQGIFRSLKLDLKDYTIRARHVAIAFPKSLASICHEVAKEVASTENLLEIPWIPYTLAYFLLLSSPQRPDLTPP